MSLIAILHQRSSAPLPNYFVRPETATQPRKGRAQDKEIYSVRDMPTKGFILSLIDDAHSSATQFLDDTVMRNGLADHSANLAPGRCSRIVSELHSDYKPVTADQLKHSAQLRTHKPQLRG